MNDIYIHCKTDAGLVLADSAGKLDSPRILDRAGRPVKAELIREQQLEDGSFRYWFDASALDRWSPDTPVLYELEANGERIRFGCVELRPEANRALLVNGNPVYLRGYIRGIKAHEHPNMTGGTLKDAAVKNIRQAKKYGFNLVRFHSTVPTPEFVEAADEEGLFIHMEIGFAYERDADGNKTNLSMNNQKWEETIRRYRNHPSVAIFCIGNEMHNSGHFKEVRILYEQGRRLAPGKLIMDNSGWGEFDRQTADVYSQHIAYFFPFKHHGGMFHSDAPWRINGSAYDEPLDAETEQPGIRTEIHRTIVPAKPTLAHEAAHYIDIPDYSALNKKFDDFCAKVGPEYLAANGIEKPRFMTALPELLKRKGLEAKVPDYIAASQQFKMAALKVYFEKCRLSDLCGFEMLQFADCLKYENKNGIVDCFDDDKFIPPAWMLQFNGNAALLADLETEVYYYGDEIKGAIYISDFLAEPTVTGGTLTLTVKKADGTAETVYTGHNVTLSGGLQKIADISMRIAEEPAAQKVSLCADFRAEGVHLENAWNLWLYPHRKPLFLPVLRLNDTALADRLKASGAPEDAGSVVTDVLDDRVFDDLAAGRTVYLMYHRDAPWKQYYLPGALERFKPCIWDRGSNLGGIVYSEPVRRATASNRYFDLNWYSLLEGGYKVCLDDFPAPVEELVCGVDKPVRDRMKGLVFKIKDFIDRDTFRNFSHLFSVKVGKGTLAVCTFNLKNPDDPVTASLLAELFGSRELVKTDKPVDPEVLKQYLADETAKGIRKEDTMNHFWEIDNKLVEDKLFWEEAKLDLRKI
ncbi:MAG: hypothetical protein IJS14_05265 [Lentisphaeria bacterium]|nr:hypothetical protein [Lentisphaeria bacterium]